MPQPNPVLIHFDHVIGFGYLLVEGQAAVVHGLGAFPIGVWTPVEQGANDAQQGFRCEVFDAQPCGLERFPGFEAKVGSSFHVFFGRHPIQAGLRDFHRNDDLEIPDISRQVVRYGVFGGRDKQPDPVFGGFFQGL
jgi:hypothetical protein